MPGLEVNIIAVIFVVLSRYLANAKLAQGTLDSNSNWEFLTRFCFLPEKGSLDYEFRYPVGYGTQDILLYYDTPGQWDSVYKRGKTCDESMSVLAITSNQILSLNTSRTQTSTFSGCSLISYNGDTWYNCAGTRRFRSSRERWWYIAVARCGAPKDQVTGLYLEFKIHMTNGDEFLYEEFSVDEFYILPIDIVFLAIYLIICTVSIVFATKLKKRQLFHATYKLFLAALFIWTAHLVVMVIAWTRYGQTGVELTRLEVTGRILQRASTTVLVLMLILMGKGYTITRGRLPRATVGKIATFITFYSVSIVALFIWEGTFFDSGKVLYYYESPPGYGIIAIHLMGWVWFLHSNIFTLKHTQKKSAFYIPFFSFYTVWFLTGPGVVLIAMFSMAKWSREKSVNGVEQFITFLGHCFFLILTRPNAANSNFPYHVRTSQIATLGTGEYQGTDNPYIAGSSLELSDLAQKSDAIKESDREKRKEQHLPPLEKRSAEPVLHGTSSLYPALNHNNNNIIAGTAPVNFLSGDINRNTSIGLNGNETSYSNSNNNNYTNNVNNNNSNNNISNNSNNTTILNANHLFSQSISIMTRRGDTSSNPLPAIGEAHALSVYHGGNQNNDSSQSLDAEHPLSPRGATAWLPKSRAQLPPLNLETRPIPNLDVTNGGFASATSSPRPSAPDYDMFQAKE